MDERQHGEEGDGKRKPATVLQSSSPQIAWQGVCAGGSSARRDKAMMALGPLQPAGSMAWSEICLWCGEILREHCSSSGTWREVRFWTGS